MAVNWDKLNVGHMDLNHSEGYFDKRHLEHERLEDLLQVKLAIVEGKNKELKAKQTKKGKNSSNKENVEGKNGEQKKGGLQKQVEATIKSMQNVAKGMTLRSHKPTVLTSVAGSRLMNYANVYEQHKKDLAEKKKQEDDKKTVVKPFKARPAPKSKPTSAQQISKPVPAKIAPAKPKLPVTKVAPAKPKPPVAKIAPTRRVTSAPAPVQAPKPEPKKKRLFVPTVARKSVTQVQKKPVVAVKKPEIKKFVANIPKYLRREPFKVNLAENKKKTTEVKPFKLSIATRIDDRHIFDAERKKIANERNKRFKEEKDKRDEEEIKKLRKMREFRASVNPFHKIKLTRKPSTTPIEELPEAQKA